MLKISPQTLVSFLILLPLILMSGCFFCPHQYIPKEEPDPLPSFCLPEKICVALVLGGGGVRGIAHVGVLEELEEAGIPIDLIVGCSAGSIVGALYANNPDAKAIKSTVASIRANAILDIDLLHCRFGLSQARSLRRILRQDLCCTTFEDLTIPLVIVASDLHTAELVPIGSGNLLKAVQASCAIPFLFVPCELFGRVLVDGGVINPVPVKVARDLGAHVIIAVDLCELMPKTFPTNLFGVAERGIEIAFMWQNEACAHGADVIIRPSTCGAGTFDDSMKWKVYEAGKRAARKQIPKIKEILAALPHETYNDGKTRLISPKCYSPQIYHGHEFYKEEVQDRDMCDQGSSNNKQKVE